MGKKIKWTIWCHCVNFFHFLFPWPPKLGISRFPLLQPFPSMQHRLMTPLSHPKWESLCLIWPPQCIRLFLYSGLYSLIGKGLSGEHKAHYRAAAHLGAAGFIWDPCSAGQTLLTPFPDLDVFGKNSPPQSHLFPNLTTPQDRGRESDAWLCVTGVQWGLIMSVSRTHYPGVISVSLWARNLCERHGRILRWICFKISWARRDRESTQHLEEWDKYEIIKLNTCLIVPWMLL